MLKVRSAITRYTETDRLFLLHLKWTKQISCAKDVCEKVGSLLFLIAG
jgi:hypothetical protein